MKVLLIHGVGYPESTCPHWSSQWSEVISKYVGVDATFDTISYDSIFQKNVQGPKVYVEAIEELLASVGHRELVGGQLGGVLQSHVGMVAQWIVETDTRNECREALFQSIVSNNPDLILAHSLGTLLSYDLFHNDPRGVQAIENRVIVTFGSQINNLFVRDKAWGGDISTLQAKRWFHLFNPNDPVFTHDIWLPDANFSSTTTAFGKNFFDVTAHDAVTDPLNPVHCGYLDHSDAPWDKICSAL
jgi:hypothetical protein